MTGKSTERVRQFRQRVVGDRCQRLEVVIGQDIVEQLDETARKTGRNRWEIVEAAIDRYCASVAGNGGKS
jgi:hypothetical protein